MTEVIVQMKEMIGEVIWMLKMLAKMMLTLTTEILMIIMKVIEREV